MATSALRPILDTSRGPRTILDTSGYGTTDVERAAADAAGGNSLTNAFTGATLNNQANQLADEESQLRIDPRNLLRANQLQSERAALKAQANQYAAPVGRWEDIHGIADTGSYIAGQMGQAAGSSLPQLATGVGMGTLATGLQALPYPLAKLAGTGLRLAAPTEMYRQNKNLLTGEAYDTVTQDPTVMKNRSAQDIRDEVSTHGYRAAVMDTLPQLLPVGQLTGGLGKTLNKIPAWGKFAGAQVGEGLTETGQEISQHYAHEALNPYRDTSGDASALQNSFLGGLAGGTGLGAAGHVGDKVWGATRATNPEAEPGRDVDLSGRSGVPTAPGRVTPRMTPDLDATLSGQPPSHVTADAVKSRAWLTDNLSSRPSAMAQHLEAMAKDGDSRAAALRQKLDTVPPNTGEQDNVLDEAYQHITDQETQAKASPKGQRRGIANAFSTIVGKAGDGFIKGFEAAGNKLVDATQGKKNMQGFDTSGYDAWLANKEEATGNARAKSEAQKANPDDYAQVDGSGPMTQTERKKSKVRAQGLADRMTDQGVNTLEVIQRSRAELMGNTMSKATEAHMATRVQMATDEDGKTGFMRDMGFEIADLAQSWSLGADGDAKNADKRITQFPGLKNTLHSIVNSVKVNTGPNAATVLKTLRSQTDLAAAPLFDMMDAELTIQGSPEAKAHAAQIHDEMKDMLLTAIPIETRHALAKADVNIESEEGRSALLQLISGVARGQLDASARKELNKHLGKETVTNLVELFVPSKDENAARQTTEAVRETAGAETVSDAQLNDETGEYEMAGQNDTGKPSVDENGTGKTAYDENSDEMHVKAINEPIYAYYQNNTLMPKKGGFLADTGGMTKTEKAQRQLDNMDRLAAGEPPLPTSTRPRLFHVGKDGKPTQKSAFTGETAAGKTVEWLETKLGLDRSVPNLLRLLKTEGNRPAARYVMDLMKQGTEKAQKTLEGIKDAFFVNRAGQYRVGTKSVGEILKKQGNSQVSVLSMHHSYLSQDATRLRNQAAKIVKTDPKKSAAMIAKAVELEAQGNDAGRVLNDMLDSKESVAKRMTPEQHAVAHKAALDYFDNHHVVVAEELDNRDNSKMTPTEFLKLADLGDRAISHSRVSGKHISELNILTFDSPRLSTHKSGKVHLTAGSIVHWVLQQRGDQYENNVEKDRKTKQHSARANNLEYLAALTEGIAIMTGSGLIKGLPTMVNAENKVEKFGMLNQELVNNAGAKRLIAENLAGQKDGHPDAVDKAQREAKIAAQLAERKRHGAPPGLMLDNATVGDMEFGAKHKKVSIAGESEGEYGHEFMVGLAISLKRLTPETMNPGERKKYDGLVDTKETLLELAEKLKSTTDMGDMDAFANMLKAQSMAMVAVGELENFMLETAAKPARLNAVKADAKAEMAAAKADPKAYNKLIADSARATKLHDGENENVTTEQLKDHDFFVPEQRREIARGEVKDNNYKRRHMLSQDVENRDGTVKVGEMTQYTRIPTTAGRRAYIDMIAKQRVEEAMKDGSWKPKGFDTISAEQQVVIEAMARAEMLRDWKEEFSTIGPFGAMFYEKSGLSSDTKIVKSKSHEGGIIVPGRVGNASTGTFHPEATARKATDTPIDTSKGQDKRTAKDEFTAQQEHSEFTGFNAGKTAGVVGGEKKKTAVFMAATNAAATIKALTSNIDEGIQLLRQRLRTAQTPAYHDAKKLEITPAMAANMAVGSLHYIVPAAYILTEERIANMEEHGATYEQMMEMAEMRLETARILLAEKGETNMKLGATRMLMGLNPRTDKTATALNFKGKLEGMITEARESGLKNADGVLYGTDPMNLQGKPVNETTRVQLNKDSDAALEQFHAQRREMDAALAEGRMPREIRVKAEKTETKQVDISHTRISAVGKSKPSTSPRTVEAIRLRRKHFAEAQFAKAEGDKMREAGAVGPKLSMMQRNAANRAAQTQGQSLGVGRTPKTKPGTNESWSQGAVDKHTAKTQTVNGRGTPAPQVMVDGKMVSPEGKGSAKVAYESIDIANASLMDVVGRMNRAETEWALEHRLQLITKMSPGGNFHGMLEDEIDVLKQHRATLPEVAELKVTGATPISAERQAVRAAAKNGVVKPQAGLLKNPPAAPDAHQAKETAKLIGADLILSPSSIEGYAGSLGRAAIAEGKAYTPAAHPNMNGKTLLVSVPGKGRGFTGMPAFIDRVMKALESGASVRTDNRADAERAWNKDGEGALREALIAGGYVEMPGAMYSTWHKGAGAAERNATLTHTQDTGIWKNEFPRILTEVRSELRQEKAAPAPAPAPIKSSRPVLTMPMNYKDGQDPVHVMRPEHRGKDTMDLILAGLRTATTGSWDRVNKLIKGDVFTVTGNGKTALVRATTDPYHVADVTAEQWSKMEGWAPSVYNRYKSSYQIQYELVDKPNRKLNAQVADPSVTPSTSPGDIATPTTREQALNIAKASAWAGKVLAKDIRVAFHDTLGFSGEWLSVPRMINIAKDAASGILGAMHHEGLHTFFTDFIANAPKTIDVFKSITENAEIKARVHALLDGYPAAQAQLNSPEEMLAYAFQFWKAGALELPYGKPKTFFQKVQKFIRQVLGKVSDYERATDLLAAFDEGKMVTQDAGKAVIAKIMAQGTWSLKARRAMDKFAQAAAEAITPTEAILRGEVDSAEARKVGLQMHTNPGDETAAGHKEGYVQAHMHTARRAVNPFMWTLKGMNPTDHVAIEKYMQAETPLGKIPYAPHRTAVEAIRANNDEFHRYMTEDRGLELGYAGKKGYYPVIWSVPQMNEKMDEFVSMLATKYADELAKIMKVTKLETPEEAAAAVHAAIIFRKGMDEKLNVQREDGVLAPYFANEESRTLNWIAAADREPFLSKDLISTMTSYYNHGAHAAEYAHRFGRKGEGLDLSLKKIGEEMKAASKKRDDDGEFENEAARVAWLARKMRGIEHAIGAQVGTLGNDVTDRVRKLNSYAMVYQNFRLLSTVLFASFADPTGMVANGATVSQAFEAFMTAMTEVVRSWANMFRTEKKEYRENYYMKLGEMTGAIEHAVVSHHVSEEYSSQWLNPLAKKLNDILFKANGMEAFDRGMRAGAMKAAVAFLLHHKSHPEQHSERWLKNLGILAHKIPINEAGQLIVTPNELMLERQMADTPENHAVARKEIGLLYDALNRWVEGAVMSPNAAHRPAWASDPHFAAMFHLKQFTYTWHRTIMKHAQQESAHGNMAPLGAIAAIVPVTLMSNVMKGLFLGGGSMPDNMAGMTFGQHVERAVQAAGVGGVGQMLGHTALHPLSAAGPMVEQVLGGAYDLITGNASGAKVTYDALPLHQLMQGLNPIK